MGIEAKANPIQVSGSNPRCVPGSVRFFSIFFTLGALALRPSDFCSTGIYPRWNLSKLTFPWRLIYIHKEEAGMDS